MRNCYIHVPFCAAKCGYCAFYSIAGTSTARHAEYLDHLEMQLSRIDDREFDTLYAGGGTPALLSAENLSRLIDILQKNLKLSAGAEISIEANPETLTPEKMAVLRPFFNRISLGVQSFDPVFRQAIGRSCSEKALQNALALIKDAAFPHWNIDLIYSLPGQSVENWKKDLLLAGETGADHVSCYSLTPEEGAAMGGSFVENDELETEMFYAAEEVLSLFGIKRYEISNYAADGCECKHNSDVWRGGVLAGFGPSAAGFDGKNRYTQVASLEKWLHNEPPETDEISPEARLNEIFAVNLRTIRGWTREMWQQLPGADDWDKRLEIAENLQKIYPEALTITPDCIKLSRTGILYWNNIAQDIL